MADLPYATCPYNKEHRIWKLRMPSHIMKCSKSYKGPPLAICKYNATHRVPPSAMEDHLEECSDKQLFHSYEIGQIAL